VRHRRLKHLPAIRKIPDDLWDEIKILLPPEKANNTIGRPIIPFRKVLNGIVHVLRTGCQWKMLPKEYGFGSTTCHRRFQQWIVSDVFRKLWIKLLERYDELKGIRWMEMAIS
jgi:transposase